MTTPAWHSTLNRYVPNFNPFRNKEFILKMPTIKSKTPLLILITFWIVFGNQVSYAETITASTRAPLTEVTLHESIVTLTLSGGTYESSEIKKSASPWRYLAFLA